MLRHWNNSRFCELTHCNTIRTREVPPSNKGRGLKHSLIGNGLALSAAVLLSACGDDSAPATPPPVPVEIVTLKGQTVPSIIELPGRIEAVRTAEVRARSDGIVLQRVYEEGAMIKAGAPLFAIDPRDYRAQVQSAEAALQRATAARENAASIVGRYKPLIKERAISAQEYDAAASDLRQTTAQVAEARAALDRARLLLSYTTVTAPIAGRAGKAEVTEGALVSGASGTLMTRVDQVSPVYAVFAESNAAFLDTMEQFRSGHLQSPRGGGLEVKLIMENGTEFGPSGFVDFASTVVDPQTGSQTIRARFVNPDGLLAPGQFVRGKIMVGNIADGIVVPARAVQFKGDDASVSLLGKDNIVQSRSVELGTLIGNGWIVKSGLKVGDKVITEGWQRVRPGKKAVIAKPGKKPAAANTATSGQGG